MKEHQKARSIRRHHAARIKHNRRHYWVYGNDIKTPRQIGMLLHTPALCSCYYCGNSRKYEKSERLTIQERRAFQNLD